MKAITLTQPWATLMAIGAKQIETRSWGAQYRGPLAIHAAKGGVTAGVRRFRESEPCRSALAAARVGVLPMGAIVAYGILVGVVRTGADLMEYVVTRPDLSPHEAAFGDYSLGRYAWIFAGVHPVPPVPCKGMLGLWTVPPEPMRAVVLNGPLVYAHLYLQEKQ